MIRSKAITQSARDENCTIQLKGCRNRTDTVVFAHINDGSKGMGLKPNDISGVYACQYCHDVIDGRNRHPDIPQYKEFYLLRAYQKTIGRLVEKGIIKVQGHHHDI